MSQVKEGGRGADLSYEEKSLFEKKGVTEESEIRKRKRSEKAHVERVRWTLKKRFQVPAGVLKSKYRGHGGGIETKEKKERKELYE